MAFYLPSTICFIPTMSSQGKISALKKQHYVQQVVDYIVENGGSIPNAVRQLGSIVSVRSVYKYAADNDIDLTRYRYARLRYGNWIINDHPPVSVSLNDSLVKATCMLCGTQKDVYLSNLRAGKSKSCKSCALKRKKSFTVLSTVTGESYRSIRDFVNKVINPKAYQKTRALLLKTGCVTIKGDEYILMSSL